MVAALDAFDQVCRPRAAFVTERSSEVCRILAGCHPGVPLRIDAVEQAIEEKWGFYRDFRIQDRVCHAAHAMDQLLSKT